MDLLTGFVIYFCLINVAAYILFAWDKYCAQNRLRRVSERSFLVLAVAGGTIGMLAGEKMLHHKTRKEPFRTYLRAIAGTQLFLLATVYFL